MNWPSYTTTNKEQMEDMNTITTIMLPCNILESWPNI